MRTIDADALFRAMEEAEWYNNCDRDVIAEKLVLDAPTIEPEQKWIQCSEHIPDEGRECWITTKTTEEVYRGIFTEFYGIRHDVGFICDDGFMWWNTAKAWMYCEKPEPYRGGIE